MRTWPLVGRDEELALLRELRRDGDVAGAVIVGRPGVGKTRLVRDFVDEVRAVGADTDWIAATASVASIPFGAFARMLTPSAPGSTGVDALHGLLDSIAARSSDLVIGVDDAHLLDEPSAALVHRVVTDRLAFVVATVRTAETEPGAITAMWKDGLAARVDLQSLSDQEVADLLAAAVGGQVDAASSRRLAAATRGNPLFLRELVLAGRSTGALAERHGVWSWVGPLGAGERMAGLVRSRISTVASEHREALDTVAVGEPLDVDVLEALGCGPSLAVLERQGLLDVRARDGGLEARLHHPIYAEVLRADLGRLDRRRICRRLAEAAEAGGRTGDLLRVATWHLEGGGASDPVMLSAAAREAIARCDQPLAERLARAAAAGGAGHGAWRNLGEALYWQGRFDEADRLCREVDLDGAPTSERVAMTVLRGSILFWGLNRAEEALAVLAQLDHEGELVSAEAAGHAATVEILAGRSEGRMRAERVLAVPGITTSARVRASGARIIALAVEGRPETAIAAARDAIPDAVAMYDDDPAAAGGVGVGQLVALLLAARWKELGATAEVLHAASVEREADDFRGLWAFFLGRAAAVSGRLDVARARLREGAALLAQQDVGRIRPWCLAALAQVDGALGDAVGAARAADAAVAESGAIRIWDVEVALGRAWAAAASGELSAARAIALEAAEEAGSSGFHGLAVLALHDAVRLGSPTAVARLCADSSPVEGDFAAIAERHARALQRDDGASLDDVALTFAELGAYLLAAEAASEAARAHACAGHSGSRVASQDRARKWLRGCGGAATPAIAGCLDAPELAWLTDRELEVARLAAKGLTRADIAARLFLSARTVANHLNHVYGKLGLSNRADLARILDSHVSAE